MTYNIDAKIIKQREDDILYFYGEHDTQRSWAGHYDELPGMNEREISRYIATENIDLFRKLGNLMLTYSDIVLDQDDEVPQDTQGRAIKSVVEEEHVATAA